MVARQIRRGFFSGGGRGYDRCSEQWLIGVVAYFPTGATIGVNIFWDSSLEELHTIIESPVSHPKLTFEKICNLKPINYFMTKKKVCNTSGMAGTVCTVARSALVSRNYFFQAVLPTAAIVVARVPVVWYCA